MIPVYCPLCCDQPFEDQASLYFHLRGVRNNLFCPICSEKFASFESLVIHLSKKCPGPESPLLAKRKCLAKINEEPIVLEKKPKLSPTLQLSVSGNTSDDYEADKPSNEYENANPEVRRKRVPKNISLVMKTPETPPLNKAEVHSQFENETSARNDVSPKFVENTSANLLCLAKKKTPVKKPPAVSEDSEIQDSSVNTTASISSESSSKPKAINRKSRPQIKPKTEKKGKPGKKPALAIDKVQASSEQQFVANEHLNLVVSRDNTSGVKSSPSKTILHIPPNSVPISPPKALKPIKKPLKPSLIILPETPKTSNSTNSKKSVENAQHSDDESDFSFDTYEDNTTNDDTVSSKSVNDSLDRTTTEAKKQESKKGKSLQNGMSFPKGKSKGVAKKSVVDGKDTNVQKSTTPEGNNDVNKKTETEDAKDGKGNENNGSAEEEYTCSACNIRFTSIYEHIKQYHNGEEVVVEVPEEELKEEVRAYQHGQESTNSQTNETIAVNGDTPKDLNTPVLKNEVSSTNKSVSVPNKESLPQNKTSKKPKQTNNRKSDSNKSNKPDLDRRESDNVKTHKPNLSSDANISQKVNRSKGKWVLTNSGKKSFFQYIYNPNKNQLLLKEMKTNKNPHPVYGLMIKTLFENPKINVVEITNKPNTAFFTDRIVDLKNPIPMYVTARSAESEKEEMLGGRASYIIANSIPASDRTTVPKDSKVIAVMKVILASDKKLTLENIVFKEKPVNEYMIPFLDDVENPELPLLEGAKMLKWRCTKCLATTWKFPLTKDSHCCFSCHLCHKPFVGTQALRSHMALHKKNLERLCAKCNTEFTTNCTLPWHQDQHLDYEQCADCRMFVPKERMSVHEYLHFTQPYQKLGCSACESLIPTSERAKDEGEKGRTRLVAKHPCAECDKKFHSLTALAYHSLDHKQHSLQYPCNFCPKRFILQKEGRPRKAGKRKPSTYIQKVWHEKIHTRKRSHRCAGCPKTFRSEWHFREHAAACHKYDVTTRAVPPIFMCEKCGHTFSNAALLEAHTASHHPA